MKNIKEWLKNNFKFSLWEWLYNSIPPNNHQGQYRWQKYWNYIFVIPKWRMHILSVWNIGPIYIQICSLPLSIETISLIRLLEYDSHVQPLCQSVQKSGIWLSARIWKPGSTVASGFWIARYSTDGICMSSLSRNYDKDGELTRLKYGVENLIIQGFPKAGG